MADRRAETDLLCNYRVAARRIAAVRLSRCSKLGTNDRSSEARRGDVKAFGTYVRALRRNAFGRGKGKSLRQVSEESGIPLSVLSRGERGLQDLRRSSTIERLAPCLGVHASIMKRVAALVTQEDVAFLRSSRPPGSARTPSRVDTRALWVRLDEALIRLSDSPPATIEALLAYVEFLAARAGRENRRTG
jgi:transcriptional regulator with XRE-family HTH domain